MTSRISSYNLRRENMKHRIGMIMLVGFLFFIYLICFLISVQNICGRYQRESDIRRNITALSEPGMYVGIIAILAAVLLAVSGFRYLHSKKEVDFYHSLPVRRTSYLCMIMTNDLLVFTFFLIWLLCLQCVVAAFAGYFSPAFGINTVWSFICYLTVFSASYLTMALAMILTGQTFVGLLAFGVMVTYMPLILYNLYPYLASVFFKTYYVEAGYTGWGTVLTYFSPLWLTGKLLNDMFCVGCPAWTWKAHGAVFAAICIWSVVIGAVVFLLFKKRPSEMAGKATAFPRANGIVRVLLVVPVSIYVGLYLYSASFSSIRGWIIAGVIIGGFIFHGVIESIYRFDIRGFFACGKQMLISIAAAVLIVGFFWADISGYDTYLPAKEDTDALLINDGYMLYGNNFWGKERKGVSGAVKDDVLDVLTDVVKENDKNHDASIRNGDTSEYSSYVIRYRLKSGREKKRAYVLDSSLNDRLMRQVFGTKEYREDHFSLYTGDWSRVRDVDFCHFMGNTPLKMTEEQRSELFCIYLNEFDKLDYDTARTTIPMGKLVLNCYTAAEDGSDYAYDAVNCGGIGDSYYIYPTFKNTIKYLENLLNEKFPLSFGEIRITKIDVWQYDGGPGEEYTITDEEFIRAVQGNFYGIDVGPNLYPQDTSLDINATVVLKDGTEHIGVCTDTETAEEIKKYHETE